MADYSQTPANVLKSANGKTRQGVIAAATTIVAGNVLYKLANGTIGLHDADGTPPANVIEGVALTGGGAGQPVVYCYDDPLFNPGMTVAAGATIIGSATAGKMAPDADKASGVTVNEIGHGLGSNNIALKIANTGAAVP
jgi:hypothetical protein